MEKKFVGGLLTERTLGDGIDNTLLDLSELKTEELHLSCLNSSQTTFKPIVPNSRIFYLKPVYVPKDKKLKGLLTKSKEPKFVPYEPYKAAVEPIIAHRTEIKRNLKPKTSRNNVEIQDLVIQMTELRKAELSNKSTEDANKESNEFISVEEWEKERKAYEIDIKNLRETNSHLENQIKFQAQVNSELKTLLVAAVGEDLESRVQHLTEDKLQLARALLNSANHLTSHQEQMEWLSGQCEVWRSKFLASSLMVEELARWKSALSTRVNDMQQTVKLLLEERSKVQKNSLKTFCFLQETLNALDTNKENKFPTVKTTNIVELSNVNCSLGQRICDLSDCDKKSCDDLLDRLITLPQQTASEKIAMKILQNPVVVCNKQDAVCNALMGSAMSLGGEQMFLKYPSNQATCCAHCTGEIKNL